MRKILLSTIAVTSTVIFTLSLSAPVISFAAMRNGENSTVSTSGDTDNLSQVQLTDLLSNLNKNQRSRTGMITENNPLESLNQFVSVKNNQFVLTIPDEYAISPEIREEAEISVKKSNQQIRENGGVIQSDNLTINYPNSTENIQIRSGINDTSVSWFWWGSRQYFWSNAAVENVAYKYDHYSQFLGVAGIAGTAVTSGVAAVIGGIGSWYYAHLASELRHYNNTHKKNKIYQDLNWAAVDSYGTY